MVIAFAGRRVDAPNATDARFPGANVPAVRERIRSEFEEHGATAIVSAAACGADLVALEAAGELGMRRVIVLPWDRDRFREGSVVDRGAEWGPIYDDIVDDVEAQGDLEVLGYPADDEAAYVGTNEAILDVAQRVAKEEDEPDDPMAVVAWNGKSRGGDDITEAFMTSARRRGMEVIELPTV